MRQGKRRIPVCYHDNQLEIHFHLQFKMSTNKDKEPDQNVRADFDMKRNEINDGNYNN